MHLQIRLSEPILILLFSKNVDWPNSSDSNPSLELLSLVSLTFTTTDIAICFSFSFLPLFTHTSCTLLLLPILRSSLWVVVHLACLLHMHYPKKTNTTSGFLIDRKFLHLMLPRQVTIISHGAHAFVYLTHTLDPPPPPKISTRLFAWIMAMNPCT